MNNECVVVGAGPAGLATSRALIERGVDHVVLERDEVGHSWRTQRWDSFRLNTPGWMNGVLGRSERDGYATAPEVVNALDGLATALPVQQRTPVQSLERDANGYVLRTPDGDLRASAVVLATGNQNTPKVPAFAGRVAEDVQQWHAAEFRNAAQLPPGAVLVVGSAQSGCQIAEDLIAAGRRVYLATSQVGRFPWHYRGRDVVEWLVEAGFYDQRPQDLEDPAMMRAAQPVVASGGRSLSLQSLARSGVMVLGRIVSVAGHTMAFDGSAEANVAYGDRFAGRVCTFVDAFIHQTGAQAPPPEPDDSGEPVNLRSRTVLDLEAAEVASIIWCTGFTGDFSWVHLPVLDDTGQPKHDDGATTEPGVWFVGLPWLTRRSSGIFLGFPSDAAKIAGAVAGHLIKS
ncbi:MAG: NAD(P)-binding domain-containing protein [Rubrobacteraceae bacterium]|nr:NAD(P)-binding domain-containing protein [Rubrobacteraceae bacterium]